MTACVTPATCLADRSRIVNEEDASNLLISLLRVSDHGQYGKYGYDVYLPNLLRVHLEQQATGRQDPMVLDRRLKELAPVFFAAGWELCRRGILRPGVNALNAQATADGNAGAGYSVTPFGRRWLEETGHHDFVPTEPGRFAEMLNTYRNRFGPGFHQRCQEAIRCYGAHAYLASAVMCGAATESIILATAIQKHGEQKVLDEYRTASGRRKVEDLIVGQRRVQLKEEYRAYTTLMKYWRDDSAHGIASEIKENEAYTSLALLLRLCLFIENNWAELTA